MLKTPSRLKIHTKSDRTDLRPSNDTKFWPDFGETLWNNRDWKIDFFRLSFRGEILVKILVITHCNHFISVWLNSLTSGLSDLLDFKATNLKDSIIMPVILPSYINSHSVLDLFESLMFVIRGTNFDSFYNFSSLRTYFTLALKRRKGNTSSRGWCNILTPISWTSNAPDAIRSPQSSVMPKPLSCVSAVQLFSVNPLVAEQG